MKKNIVLLVLIGALAFGCSSEETTKENTTSTNVEKHSKEKVGHEVNKNTKKIITKHEDTKKLITNGAVGRYVLGQQLPIPYPEDNYRITKEVEEVMEEGEKRKEITFKVTESGNYALKIIPMEGEDPNKSLRTMSELIVYSEKYKTGKGIGVGATIEDFIVQYPDYSLWYSYVGDQFVVQAPHLQAQFYLDAKDFKGKKDTSSDKVSLSKDDFAAGAKIQSIRVY